MAKGYDDIIVGAGSAGSVIAHRLTEDPDRRVLLIEAGGSDSSFWSRLPVGYYKIMTDPKRTWSFATEPSEGTAGRTVTWPRGKMLGGSSSINGLIFIRGQHRDFDDWDALGAQGWAYRDVLPFFRKLESYKGGESQQRGALGPIKVDDLRNENRANDAWLASCEAYGLPRLSDFNAEPTQGAAQYQLTLDGRWRSSAARAYLRPAKARPNLTISTGVQVEKILFDGTRAIGVAWRSAGGTQKVYADRVVLSAGAIQSPHLLQLSGVGPADLLHTHGVDVVADVPGVGENLQDHYQVRAIVELTERISLNDTVRDPFGLAKMGLDWLLNARGPLTVGAGQVGAAIASKHSPDGRPDLQLLAMPLSVDLPGQPLHEYSGFTTVIWQCHPESRGTIQLASADPNVPPVIRPNYLSAEHDRKVMVDGVKIMRRIQAQSPFRDMWCREVVPGPDVHTDDEILDTIRKTGSTVYHATCTCRMGRDPMSVVDPDTMAVHGVDGLHVADASVMPKITSANTNAPTLMIGEKAADILKSIVGAGASV